MGAVIGSDDFKSKYVTEKVVKWTSDVKTLAKIAKDEPQAAYSAFVKSVSHRWNYIQRTVPNISHLFEPLEEAIWHVLIPALIGRKISALERRIVALPVKLGGLGILNPTTTSDIEFNNSIKITANLTKIIIDQDLDYSRYDKRAVINTKKN